MSLEPNRVAIALAIREAMRAHRRGKPIVFTWPCFPQQRDTRPSTGVRPA